MFFIIYSPRTIIVEEAENIKIETNIILDLPKKPKESITSKFRGQEFHKINKEKTRLRIEKTNTSYTDRVKILKNAPVGFLVIESEHLKFKHEKKKKQKKRMVYLKSGSRHRRHTGSKKNLQWGGFFGRYDFAYAGRDTVNQVGKIAPGLIKQATSEIDKIARNRVNQVIKSEGAEVERVLPKIIRGAIEDVYKTPFRLLGNFGKQQLNKINKKILLKDTIYVFFIYVYNKI